MVAAMMGDAPDVEFVFYAPWPVHLGPGSRDFRIRIPERRCCAVPGFWVRRVLPSMIANDRIDVFWGQNNTLPLVLRRPCYRILTIHDLTAVIFPQTMRFRHRVSAKLNLRRAVCSADKVVAVSKCTAVGVSRWLGVEPSRIEVIYEGCDQLLVPVSPITAARHVERVFGIKPGYILTVGTLEPRKDHATLLSAVMKLRDAPQLVVVGGEGWRCRETLQMVRALQASGRARYLGRVSDDHLPALYGAAALSVYSSYYEGFGLPVLEAMACGCPVLCSWSSSLPEVAGNAAWYFRPRDADDLSRKLGLLLEDSRRADTMRRAGLVRSSGFSFGQAARQLLTLVREGYAKTWRCRSEPLCRLTGHSLRVCSGSDSSQRLEMQSNA
jgi:glycosyltransferase involved in cell wall biosynthesis